MATPPKSLLAIAGVSRLLSSPAFRRAWWHFPIGRCGPLGTPSASRDGRARSFVERSALRRGRSASSDRAPEWTPSLDGARRMGLVQAPAGRVRVARDDVPVARERVRLASERPHQRGCRMAPGRAASCRCPRPAYGWWRTTSRWQGTTCISRRSLPIDARAQWRPAAGPRASVGGRRTGGRGPRPGGRGRGGACPEVTKTRHFSRPAHLASCVCRVASISIDPLLHLS
jgi:hypothetical protein